MRPPRRQIAFVCLTWTSLMSAARISAADEGTPREVGSPPPPSATPPGFDFGSYGRVGVGSDLRGHEGYATNVVSHGSRLEEPPYLELDLYYGGLIDADSARRW